MRIHRPALFAIGMLLLVVVGGVFVVPSAIPQPTCDAFGSLMACPDGATPVCANVPAPRARRNEKELSITCNGKERSAAPMYGVAGGIALVFAAMSLTLVVLGLKGRRAPT